MYQELQRVVSEAKELLAALGPAAEAPLTEAEVKPLGQEDSGL